MSAVDVSLVDVLAPVEQEGTTAAVKAWLKQVGDRVEADEPLLELDTDKVAMEVAAPVAGVLAEILIPNGREAEKGAVLGRISVGVAPAEAPAAAVAAGAPGVVRVPATLPLRTIASFDPALRLSPSVRRLLIDTDMNPAGLTGTGRGGRLTSGDIEREADRRRRASVTTRLPHAGAVGVARTQTPVASPRAGTRVPHSAMRRRIAEHMVHSLATAPHVTALFEADFGAILAHRDAHKAAFQQQDVHLTLTAYFVMAAVEAMTAVPVVNSRWHDDFLEVFDDVNIGVGTALGDKGLIVPVVHRAQTLSLIDVAARLQHTTAAARAGTLSPADIQGGTFTISNHGVSGSLTAVPIVINQPQAAILGVGAVQTRVVVREVHGTDAILIRPMSYVTLSIDHRAIDGAQTNAWLTRFVQAIEHWPSASEVPAQNR